MDSGPPASSAHAASADSLRAEIDAAGRRQRGALAAFDAARRAARAGHFTRARWHLAHYRRRVRFDAFPVRDRRTHEPPALSTVIVAYRTGRELLACVQSALDGNVAPHEIILVDNGGNDAVLESLLAQPVLYVRCPVNLGAAEGRNVGAHFARAPVIAFLDDDALAAPAHGQALLEAFDDPAVHAVRGRVLPKDEASHTQAAPHYDLGDRPLPALADTEGNSAFRTATYRALGGMDPLLFGHEGNEISCRIVLCHGRRSVLYWPAAVIRHDYAMSKEKLATKTERHREMMRYLRWRTPEAVALMRELQEGRERPDGGDDLTAGEVKWGR